MWRVSLLQKEHIICTECLLLYVVKIRRLWIIHTYTCIHRYTFIYQGHCDSVCGRIGENTILHLHWIFTSVWGQINNAQISKYAENQCIARTLWLVSSMWDDWSTYKPLFALNLYFCIWPNGEFTQAFICIASP